MDVVLESYKDGIYTITLNRPEKKNAMDFDLLKGLYDAMKRADAEQPPFIVIRGSGKAFCSGGDLIAFKEAQDAGKAFCSGGDLIAFKEAQDAEALIDAEAAILNESIKLIRNTAAIVIAVVEGVAVGAGLGLSLACDLSIATKNTIMNMGYRRIGLTPDGGGSIFLPRLIGAKRFNELYLFSRNINMAQAQELGIVNLVCEEEELEAKLNETIKNLKALPMETIKYFKDLVNNAIFFGLANHLDKERFYVAELAAKPLFKERIEGFLRKK
ncbi:MAG: enoyl-CoA hydratase-related protein [Proteobacteria bacterium]|nr:enoyl-CoA hydratase-related protein [Pseudomonadota bacterium]